MLKTSTLRIIIPIAYLVVTWPAFAQEGKDSGGQNILGWNSPLVWVECAWFMLIGTGVFVHSKCVGQRIKDTSNLKGLNMPRRSIRTILSLLVVGSFVNVLLLGRPELGDSFKIVVSTLGALTGSIIGILCCIILAMMAKKGIPAIWTSWGGPD